MDLRRSAYSVRALRLGQYASYHFFVDQSSSRRLEKFGEDTHTSPKGIGEHTLNFKPNFKFSLLTFLGDPLPLRCALARFGQSLASVKI